MSNKFGNVSVRVYAVAGPERLPSCREASWQNESMGPIKLWGFLPLFVAFIQAARTQITVQHKCDAAADSSFPPAMIAARNLDLRLHRSPLRNQEDPLEQLVRELPNVEMAILRTNQQLGHLTNQRSLICEPDTKRTNSNKVFVLLVIVAAPRHRALVAESGHQG